jgi:hypothetical protein
VGVRRRGVVTRHQANVQKERQDIFCNLVVRWLVTVDQQHGRELARQKQVAVHVTVGVYIVSGRCRRTCGA